MEVEGMTDLQFKSFIRQLVGQLEDARNKPTLEETQDKLDKMIDRFRSDLQSCS